MIDPFNIIQNPPLSVEGPINIYHQPFKGKFWVAADVTEEIAKGGPVTHTLIAYFNRYMAAYSVLQEYSSRVTLPIVLDLGCGRGELLRSLEANGQVMKYVGMDVNYDHMLSTGMMRAKSEMCLMLFTAGGEWPIKKDSIDIIIGFEILEHMNQTEGAMMLKEIGRCLKRSGICLLSTPLQPEVGDTHSAFHVHEYTRMELASLLSESPLKVVKKCGISAHTRALEKEMSKDELELYYRLSKVYPTVWVNQIFAISHFGASWDALFYLKRRDADG